MQEASNHVSYFSILKRAATCDGTYCDSERNVLMAIAHNMGVDQDQAVLDIIESSADADSHADLRSICDVAKRPAIRDALLISLADGKHSPEEEAYLKSLCRDLDVPEDFLNKAKNWAERYCSILHEGQQLFA